MKNLFSPEVFPGTVIGNTDAYIKNIFIEHSSDNVALIDLVWDFRHQAEIIEFAKQNLDKHLLLLSATDPFPFQPRHALPVEFSDRPAYQVLADHPAGYTLIGNVFGKNYFSLWLEFLRTQFEYDVDYSTGNIDKLYMCLNRKPHHHRVQFVKSLFDNQLENDGLLSLGKSDGYTDDHYQGLPIPIKLKTDIFDQAGQAAVAGDVSGISCNVTSLGHLDNWKRFFLNIVVETQAGRTDFISEKTLKPIIGCKPFAFVGCSKQYEILHSWGIDTFNDILGLDYTEEDRQAIDIDIRIKNIIQVLEDLKKENLNLLYKSMLPRLQENRKALLNAVESNHKYIIDLAKSF